MSRTKNLPVALCIAGSDSGGGAGIQADLKTFAAFGVHGATAITCITAQNPRRVLAVQACRPEIVRKQIEAVFQELRPAAVKTGMLYSEEIIRVIADFFGRPKRPPLVVDPVMIASSGARLLKNSAVAVMTTKLLPMAALVTPNVFEAEVLIGRRLKAVEDLRAAAREIHLRFGCAALVKGGHLRGINEAADIFFDGENELLLTAPFMKGVKTHGTGCSYSAAITAGLALGEPLARAVASAKDYITQAIARSQRVRTHSVLNNLWPR